MIRGYFDGDARTVFRPKLVKSTNNALFLNFPLIDLSTGN